MGLQTIDCGIWNIADPTVFVIQDNMKIVVRMNYQQNEKSF